MACVLELEVWTSSAVEIRCGSGKSIYMQEVLSRCFMASFRTPLFVFYSPIALVKMKKKGFAAARLDEAQREPLLFFLTSLKLGVGRLRLRSEVASAAVHHGAGVFQLAPLVMATPACLRGGGERMGHLECPVSVTVEQFRRILCDCGGKPGAPFGPLLGEGLEPGDLAPLCDRYVAERGSGDRLYDVEFGLFGR